MSFVFFDTETTGTNLAFDQILQFAAILTDEELVERDRIDIRCRLLPHIVPSPEALLVNGTTADRLGDGKLASHYEMIRNVFAQLSAWSPTLFIGYNSLSFDEHLLRYAFYQTLHQPYLTSLNGNCRADALRLARFAAEFAPDCLKPARIEDRVSFKLDHVAVANGFPREGAHDALNDVQATIHLCKLVMERAPELWSSFTRFAQKRAAVDFIETDLVFGLCTFSGNDPTTHMLTRIAVSPSLRADYLTLDLLFEPSALRKMSDDELLAEMSQAPYVVRRIRTNACPALLDADVAISKSTARDVGLEELEQRAAQLHEDDVLKQRLIALSEKSRKIYPPSPHVEQQLYERFIPDADRDLLPSFHEAPWEHRESVIEKLQDRRLKQLGRRLIFFERPDVLDEERRKAITRHVAERMVKGDGAESWLCLEQAIEQTQVLLVSASESERALLTGHHDVWSKQLADLAADFT